MPRNKTLALFFALTCGFLVQVGWAKDTYIQQPNTQLRSRPAFRSPVVSLLPQGAQVQILAEKKIWVKIRHQQKQGWLPRLAIKNSPPMARLNDPSRDLKPHKKLRRRLRLRTVQSATGVRGLMSGRDRLIERAEGRDWNGLEKMEQGQISSAQGKRFLEN